MTRFAHRTLIALAIAAAPTVLAAQQGKSAPPRIKHPDASVIEQPRVMTKHELYSEDRLLEVLAIEQVWSAYVFYNDARDGEGIASLFTEDGVDQHLWNNYGVLVPSFGTGAVQTPEGINGEGCVLRGRKEIAWYFGGSRGETPLALPAHSHHATTSKMVKVYDDGTAMMNATWLTASIDKSGQARVGGTGSYRAFFRKTSDGWQIAELYAINDHPTPTDRCDLHGPLPRVPGTSEYK